jgi:hypothetical protein
MTTAVDAFVKIDHRHLANAAEIPDRFVHSIGTQIAHSSPARSDLTKVTESRRSVLSRSPQRFRIKA